MLLKMRRQYTVKEYRRIAEEIRRRRPGFNLTTDIIVGFPGETEEDFAESCRVARELEFSHIHTFKYSKRKGTRAARMPDQVDEQVKTERSAIIREISDENKRRYRERHIGETRELLVERVEEQAQARGYAEHYVPVSAPVPGAETNAFYPVRITGITDDEDPVLIGEPL
jgi:threonylcarbamoyladenosine tRNA methylthiotransferase MtaB